MISPPAETRVYAYAKLRQGEVIGQVPTSTPLPLTKTRLLAAIAEEVTDRTITIARILNMAYFAV